MLLDDWLEALDGEEPSYGLLSAYTAPSPAPAPAPAPVAPVAAVAAEPAGQWVRMPSGGEGWEDVFVPAAAPAPVAQPYTEALGYAPFDWAKYGYTGGNPVVMADVQSGGEGAAFTSPVAGVTPEFANWLDSQGLQVKNYGDDSGAVGVWDLSKNGQLVDRHVDQISSTDQLLNQLAPAIISAVAAPGLGQALFGGGLLGAAGAGALLGGVRAAGEGDNILEGAAKGGASGALGNLISSAFAGGNALAGASPVDALSIMQEGIPELTSAPISLPASLTSSVTDIAPQLAISPVDAGSILSEGVTPELLAQPVMSPDVIQQLLPQVTPEVAQQISQELSQQVVQPEPMAAPSFAPEPVYTPQAAPALSQPVMTPEEVLTPEAIQQLIPEAPPEVIQQIIDQINAAPTYVPDPVITPEPAAPINTAPALSEPVINPQEVLTPEAIQQLIPEAPPEVIQQILDQVSPAITPAVESAAAPVPDPAKVDYSLTAPKAPGLTPPALGPGYDLAPAPVFDNGSGLLGSPDTLSSLSAPIYTYIPPADYTLSTPTSGLQPTAVPSNIGITAPAAGGGTLTQFGVIPDTASPMLGSGGLLNSGASAAQTTASNTSTPPDPYANETAKLIRQQELAQSGTQGGGLGNMSGSAAVLPSQVVNLTPMEEAMQSLKKYTGGFSDWVKENPLLARVIFTGGGALLSTMGGGGSGGGGGGYTYKGPIPTIKRTPFQAPTPRYLTPTPDSLLSVPRGNSNDGLLRFLGG